MMRGGVVFQPLVERKDLRGRMSHCLHDRFAVARFIITDGKNRSEDNANAVCGSEIGHRHEIAFDRVESGWTSVACEIVCAGEYHDSFRLEVNHVGAKTDEHLRCRLPADTAIDIRLARKEPAVL